MSHSLVVLERRNFCLTRISKSILTSKPHRFPVTRVGVCICTLIFESFEQPVEICMPKDAISTKRAFKNVSKNTKNFPAPSAPRLVSYVFSMPKSYVFIFFRAAKKNPSVTQDPESKPRALIILRSLKIRKLKNCTIRHD